MGFRWRRFDRRNIRRRVRLRMESQGMHELDKYARLVISNEEERQVLNYLLRLTITRFFRNADLWYGLEELFVQIGETLGDGEELSIWSAGCAGGEEPFSAAMLLDDLCESQRLTIPWTILGTDTDPSSLERTRDAAYKWGSVREVPAPLFERWFTEEDKLWVLDPAIRNLVTFRHHDITADEPPGRFHMVFLRNSVLTYNVEEVQFQVLNRIRGCLLDPGDLVIGRTETMPEGAGFEKVSQCIYRLT